VLLRISGHLTYGLELGLVAKEALKRKSLFEGHLAFLGLISNGLVELEELGILVESKEIESWKWSSLLTLKRLLLLNFRLLFQRVNKDFLFFVQQLEGLDLLVKKLCLFK